MKSQTASVTQMLRLIQSFLKEDPMIKPLSIRYFTAAFNLTFAEASPIPGWCGFGGELSDRQICKLISPYLYS